MEDLIAGIIFFTFGGLFFGIGALNLLRYFYNL